MDQHRRIRTAQSCAQDTRQAVREFHSQVSQPDMAMVVFFCSSQYDLTVLAEEMNRLFQGIPVVGCTAAGEIGPSGYSDHSISGASFPSVGFTVTAALMDRLQDFEVSQGQFVTGKLLQQLEAHAPGASADNSFALLLIDGLSRREELVTHTLQTVLGRIPMIGGSAGDDLKFARTSVFCDGVFHSDAAVLILVYTTCPYRVFKTQHFITQEERLVVTEADAPRRIVKEINGLPAADEYARLIGASVDDLTPERFAASPVVVLIDGTDYVRSIQKANPDHSLTFYCAIEVGLVLRVARGVDVLEDLERTFGNLQRELGKPQTVFAFDCILRSLEITQKGLKEPVGNFLRRHHTVGFSTYGEQYGGVHVNQTLTGIAIGSQEVRRHDSGS